jgi:hypothetical protein
VRVKVSVVFKASESERKRERVEFTVERRVRMRLKREKDEKRGKGRKKEPRPGVVGSKGRRVSESGRRGERSDPQRGKVTREAMSACWGVHRIPTHSSISGTWWLGS